MSVDSWTVMACGVITSSTDVGSDVLAVLSWKHVTPGVGNERVTDQVCLADNPAHAAVVVEHRERGDVQLRQDLGGVLDGGLASRRRGLSGHDLLHEHGRVTAFGSRVDGSSLTRTRGAGSGQKVPTFGPITIRRCPRRGLDSGHGRRARRHRSRTHPGLPARRPRDRPTRHQGPSRERGRHRRRR